METPIHTAQAFAYAELLEILNYMPPEDVHKIPISLINLFKASASTSYVPHLNPSIPLENQNLAEETCGLLGMLTVNYWCHSPEEKQQFLQIFHDNEKQYQEELHNRYNPNSIFNTSYATTSSPSPIENPPQETTPSPSALPIDYTAFSWYQKIWIKIKHFIYSLFQKGKQSSTF